MYAYAKVMHRAARRAGAARGGADALRRQDLFQIGEKSFCWKYENGLAKRVEVQTGVSDGEWIEVTNRRISNFRRAPTCAEPWKPFDGTEQVIDGNLSILANGGPVTVAPVTEAKAVTQDEGADAKLGGQVGVESPGRIDATNFQVG